MKTENPMEGRSTFWSNLFKTPAEKTDLENLLSAIPPFEKFSPGYIKSVLQIVHNRVYTANEYIFYQGDPGIALYIIREGKVKIIKSDAQGNDTLLARFSRGDFFGEIALIDNDVRSASAVAETDCKLVVIFKPDLDRFMEKNPQKGIQILRGITKIIATRLRILDDEYISLYNKANKN